MSPDIDSILDEITPREKLVPIITRGDLSAELEQLEAKLRTMVTEALADPPERVEVAEQIKSLEAETEKHTRVFRVRSIGPDYGDLFADHPPTDEQRQAGYDYNPKTFQPAAVAACCVDPAMSAEKAELLRKRLSQGQWAKLVSAAIEVNVGPDSVPKSGLATVVLRSTERQSIPPASSESPEESSLADG
jgi:hypothetical protein